MVFRRAMNSMSCFSPCHIPSVNLRDIPVIFHLRRSHSRACFSQTLTQGGKVSHVRQSSLACCPSALKAQSGSHLSSSLTCLQPPVVVGSRGNSRITWAAASWIMFPLLAAALPSQADASSAQSGSEPQGTVIFTSFGCPYCKRAKATLGEAGVAYREVGVDPRPELREALARITGRKSVPVVYVNGKYIGGSDELEEVVKQKQLAALLQSPSQEIPTELQRLADAPPSGAAREGGGPSSKSQIRRSKLEQIAGRMGEERGGGGENGCESGVGGGGGQKAFSGEKGVKWMMDNMPDVLDPEEAVGIGREMQQAQLLHHLSFSAPFSTDADTFFQLHSDSPPLNSALNARTAYLKPARPASEVASDLRTKVLELYDFALSKDGRSVNYGGLAGSREYSAYVAASQELQRVDIFALSRKELLAFWINIYNALIIHAMVESGRPKSSTDRLQFYRSNKYHVAGHNLSLDDIEHGILRGNRKTLLNFFGARLFGPCDPRRFFALTPLDPRIHFALNCGAKSCPPIKVFSESNLDAALDGAVSAFCEGEVRVDLSTNVITLSKILDWYKVDFGSNQEERLKWLLQHVDGDNKRKLEVLIRKGGYTVEYAPYDWSVNE